MNTASAIADALLTETVAKYDNALELLKRANKLRIKQVGLQDELRHGLELRRELARHGLTLDDVETMIKRGHVPQPRKILATQANADWSGAKPDDQVGAELKDGTTVYFQTPVKPAAFHDLEMGRDPFSPQGNVRSQMHNQMQREYGGNYQHQLRKYADD